MNHVAEKIQKLYEIVRELEQLYPGRKFTPDGHLVGSIGEVYAADTYGLSLFTASAETHDAESRCGKKVQIKATQGAQVGIRSMPQHLLVLFISANGEFSEIYNGPGELAWNAAGGMQKNGQRSIRVSKLKRLMSQVDPSQIINAITVNKSLHFATPLGLQDAATRRL